MNASDLLRAYGTWECGKDGYPYAWHREMNLPSMHPHGMDTQPQVVPAIKDYIRELAGHRCQRCGHPYRKGEVGERGEWSPCDDSCTHEGPIRYRFADEQWCDFGGVAEQGWQADAAPALLAGDVEAKWRILTVHHLDEDKGNCRWWNLAALCQRCHLRMQRAVVMGRAYHFEHSSWFKPYAAGFYAWKYLDEDLTREETMARLDELLALEHRFTQEALL